MKTFLKLFAIAAAFGLASAAVPAAAQAPAANSVSSATPAQVLPSRDANAAASTNATAPATTPPSAAANAAAANASAPPPVALNPSPEFGQPNPERIGLQPPVSPIGERGLWFHNTILVPLIIAISVFVLLLLLWVIVRYRRGANPVPTRNTHNTVLEIIWTVVPVLILVAIALPSIDLLQAQYNPPRADVTVKVTGNQWYWSYEYPDMGIQFDSNILTDEQAAARHEPRQLAVDNRMVVPVGAVVKVITTSNDVIHSFGVPAFWIKMDAVPGRLNETWFQADRPGVYYGVCYELCGARHGYMPISVEVVSREDFARWVASRHGHMPGAAPAAAPAQAAQPAAVGATEGTASTPAPTNVAAGTATPATTNQGATR
ncbi:MAG: cytochrome c oxidase subunit II [Sphingomonadaceae bacterium]|nr:cytochrome c oxidase subunit II [Sphingomonadaceae bacterium]